MLAAGIAIDEIGRTKGLPSANHIRQWLATKPDFAEDSLRAMETGCTAMAHDCLRIADDPDLEPHDKRIRIDTRMRLMGKWNRKLYGDKVTVEHDASDKLVGLIQAAEQRIKQAQRVEGKQHDSLPSSSTIDIEAEAASQPEEPEFD
jgi:hypothetical protein